MTPIEQFIQNELDRTIENKHLASKAWVKEQLLTNVPASREECKKKMYATNYSIQVNAYPSRKWTDNETEELKRQINIFLEHMGMYFNRTPASVKAKMFRIFQESYKTV